jgi:hypothetical protein
MHSSLYRNLEGECMTDAQRIKSEGDLIEKAVVRQRAAFNSILERVLSVSTDFKVNIVRTGPRDKRLM